MRVYLADLGHNLLTKSSDVYPLGVANLATFATANLRTTAPLHIEIFREPQDLRRALDREAPDVLGLSNYAWNEELSASFATYAKRRSPATLTVMGGPNYPLTPDVQATFLRGLPQVDVYVDGPTYEAERAFLNLLQRFADTGRAEGVFEEPVPGITWSDRATGTLVKGPDVERITDLDDIPSPYLLGWMDAYLSTGYYPLLQIARGCPFSCAFCNSGVASNSRVRAHSVQAVKEDLEYIARRIRPEIMLCFADDNFGMYARDEEIADYIGWLQDTYHWPKYIRTTTGKNNGERIIRVMRKAKGALPMTAAVQSMNPQVLKNIKRDNIKLDTYRLIQEELDRQGMQSYGELILCLPGESKASFMQAVESLLDAGAKRISAHQLMLLHGAELGNPDQRVRFGFDTRFRVVARNIGDYGDGPVVEVEEMVVATPDFDFQDYLDTRVFHLLLTIYHYEGNYEEAFALAAEQGIKPFDLIVRMQKILDRAPQAFRKVIDDFLAESVEEIFPTRQACLDWAMAHYPALVDGSKGGNLLSKYSMIGRFYATKPSLDFLEATIATLLAERGRDDGGALPVVMSYLGAVALHVPFSDSMAREAGWLANYDVEAWARDRFTKPLTAYALPEPRMLRARVSPEVQALLESRVAMFGEHPSGLGKFTRSMFARDLRRTMETPALAEATP